MEATPARLSCSGAAMVNLCTEVLDEHTPHVGPTWTTRDPRSGPWGFRTGPPSRTLVPSYNAADATPL